MGYIFPSWTSVTRQWNLGTS